MNKAKVSGARNREARDETAVEVCVGDHLGHGGVDECGGVGTGGGVQEGGEGRPGRGGTSVGCVPSWTA
jgi:hypothetical protein